MSTSRLQTELLSVFSLQQRFAKKNYRPLQIRIQNRNNYRNLSVKSCRLLEKLSTAFISDAFSLIASFFSSPSLICLFCCWKPLSRILFREETGSSLRFASLPQNTRNGNVQFGSVYRRQDIEATTINKHLQSFFLLPSGFSSPTSLSLPLPFSMLRKLCRRVGLSFSFHAKKFFKVTTNQRRSQEAIGQKSRQQNYFKLRNHNPYGNKN